MDLTFASVTFTADVRGLNMANVVEGRVIDVTTRILSDKREMQGIGGEVVGVACYNRKRVVTLELEVMELPLGTFDPPPVPISRTAPRIRKLYRPHE